MVALDSRSMAEWGAGALEQDFALALAALGALAPHLPTEPADLGDLLAQRVATSARSRSSLVWDLGALGPPADLDAVLRSTPVMALAAAWKAAGAGDRALEIRPVPWLDPAWAFRMLSRAVGRGLPYVALPPPSGRLRWNWPIRIGFLADADSSQLREQLYGSDGGTIEKMTDVESGPGRTDILIVPPARTAPPAPGSAIQWPDAALIIRFQDPGGRGRVARVRQLATSASAWGAVVAEVETAGRREWFQAFVEGLSRATSVLESLRTAGGVQMLYAAPRLISSVPFDEATAALGEGIGAASALGLRVDDLADQLAGSLAFDPQLDPASHAASVGRTARPALDALERLQGRDRFIRAYVRPAGADSGTLLRHGFRAGAVHRVTVSIGPREGRAIVADVPIETDLPPSMSGHRLTVVLAEPALLERPLVGTIDLPAFAESTSTDFDLPVKRTSRNVEARITVVYRGRVLQTAVMRGPVFGARDLARRERLPAGADRPRIRILAEAFLRPGLAALDDRTRFHAAVVLNSDGDGRKGGAAIGRDKAAFFQFDWVKEAVSSIGLTFEAAEKDSSFGRALDSKKSVEYLRQLALQGVTLYQKVGRTIETTFPRRSLERLQIVSANPDTILPVEIIYDFAPPTSEPGLCSNWKAALEAGRCSPARFHQEDDEGHLDVVCPAGFWGISKIIERQAVDPARLAEDPAAGGANFAVLSIPDRARSTVRPVTSILFAASDHVNDVDRNEVKRVRGSLEKLTDAKVEGVSRWKDWAGRVKTGEPPVLVLLSHTELNTPAGAALEIGRIGGPERRVVAEITRNYVNVNAGEAGPIVMLLGCTTAVPLGNFQSFVVQFAEMGASLVLGTVAPVLGRHAGRTAEALIEHLQAVQAAGASPDHGITFGQALRDIRRRMLAKGILMSMSLAAYGDADWRLPAAR